MKLDKNKCFSIKIDKSYFYQIQKILFENEIFWIASGRIIQNYDDFMFIKDTALFANCKRGKFYMNNFRVFEQILDFTRGSKIKKLI